MRVLSAAFGLIGASGFTSNLDDKSLMKQYTNYSKKRNETLTKVKNNSKLCETFDKLSVNRKNCETYLSLFLSYEAVLEVAPDFLTLDSDYKLRVNFTVEELVLDHITLVEYLGNQLLSYNQAKKNATKLIELFEQNKTDAIIKNAISFAKRSDEATNAEIHEKIGNISAIFQSILTARPGFKEKFYVAFRGAEVLKHLTSNLQFSEIQRTWYEKLVEVNPNYPKLSELSLHVAGTRK
jgi:hypothetical protein